MEYNIMQTAPTLRATTMSTTATDEEQLDRRYYENEDEDYSYDELKDEVEDATTADAADALKRPFSFPRRHRSSTEISMELEDLLQDIENDSSNSNSNSNDNNGRSSSTEISLNFDDLLEEFGNKSNGGRDNIGCYCYTTKSNMNNNTSSTLHVDELPSFSTSLTTKVFQQQRFSNYSFYNRDNNNNNNHDNHDSNIPKDDHDDRHRNGNENGNGNDQKLQQHQRKKLVRFETTVSFSIEGRTRYREGKRKIVRRIISIVQVQ